MTTERNTESETDQDTSAMKDELSDDELDTVTGGLQGLGRIGPPLLPDANPASGAWNMLLHDYGYA